MVSRMEVRGDELERVWMCESDANVDENVNIHQYAWTSWDALMMHDQWWCTIVLTCTHDDCAWFEHSFTFYSSVILTTTSVF